MNNEAGDDEREAEQNAQLTETARKERKKERTARRLEKEAREKALKRVKKREEKEKRDNDKRYDLDISSTHNINTNVITHREALLEAITVHVVSSDPSSSEGDEAEQLSNKLSNLKAIATVEEETLRYKYSTLDLATNNTFPFRQEKAKAKKRKRRHPRYDYLHGKSLILNNLQRSNKILLQHASISLRAKAVRAQETSYIMDCTYLGRYGISNINLAPSNIHNSRNCREQPLPQPLMPGKGTPASEAPPTGGVTSTPSPTGTPAS